MTTTGTLERNHGTFEGVGRLRLQYRSWEVPAPKAAVVFVHGFSDHSGRYESFAETLATFGVSTFAFDLRGHGQSDGRRGYVRRFEIYLQELDRFRQEVQGLVAGDCPLFLAVTPWAASSRSATSRSSSRPSGAGSSFPRG